MLAIAFTGVIMHELPKQQIQALVTALKTEAGENCLLACNANGVFASAPGLAAEVELFFDSGIELIFLGEQAIARNSGRNELEKKSLPILRPLNLTSGLPGTGSRLISIGNEKIWMLSVTDQSQKTPVELAHESLDEFFGNKNDEFPVFINVNGRDLEYKKALAWKYSNYNFSVAIVGTGLNCQCGAPKIDGRGNLFLADAGVVATGKSIAGAAPESWWKKNVERVPVTLMPDNSPVEGDFCVLFYENGKVVKALKNSIVL